MSARARRRLQKRTRSILVAVAIAAVAAIWIWEAIASQIPLPQSPGREQGLTNFHWEPAHAGAFAANVVLFAVVAPFVEELTFRGAGQSLLRIPGQRYAVFFHAGHISAIRMTWRAIFDEWLPAAGLRATNGPEFERYDERFDVTTGDGGVEIWIPVASS